MAVNISPRREKDFDTGLMAIEQRCFSTETKKDTGTWYQHCALSSSEAAQVGNLRLTSVTFKPTDLACQWPGNLTHS